MSTPQPGLESASVERARCAGARQRLHVAEFMEAASRAAYEHDDETDLDIRAAIPAIGCQVCQGEVSVDSAGGIVAPDCKRTGKTYSEGVSCELDLMRTQPDLFTENGERVEGIQYYCGATVCTASVEWKKRSSNTRPYLKGTCPINVAGEFYRTQGREIIASLLPEVPGEAASSNEIPRFDGER